jgi:hypothetical protein
MAKGQKGQAILLIVVAMGIVVLGALGLAVDGSQYYTQRTMAQAAADGAAEAGIMSIFNGTNTSGSAQFATNASITCSATYAQTPCAYAKLNGFGTADDTVLVEFNPTVTATGVTLSGSDPTNLIRVTITRTFQTSFMRMLGASSASIKAAGTAAIVLQTAAIPIIITHPSMVGALAMNGNPNITICGGANRSIQVNSTSSTALTVGNNPTVDLSRAGKDDLLGDCSLGTGGDFANRGGPTSFSGTLLLGTRPGVYVQPAAIINDPLSGVPQPTPPGTAGATVSLPAGAPAVACGCPAGQDCTLFMPGNYSSPNGLSVKNTWALFAPGIYYISGGGFNMQSNSGASMATTSCTSITTPVPSPSTGNGMMVFNTGNGSGDIFSFDANAGTKGSITLVGSDSGSTYQGILFFEDRTASAHSANKAHSLQGGATISLRGTIYITNTRPIMVGDATQYQTLSIQGNPSGTTTVIGEIITSNLTLGGSGTIRMQLNPTTSVVREVALVK